MAGKHKTKRDARRVARARMKVINQVAAIGLLLIAAAVITWIIISAIQSNQADKGSTPDPESGLPTLIGTKQYSGPPPMLIEVSKKYLATVKMAKGGEYVIQLLPDKAPITVNSFVFLAREGFFDGVTFHRVLEGFMAQGGDPTGTGSGGPGYEFVNELNDLAFDKPGVAVHAGNFGWKSAQADVRMGAQDGRLDLRAHQQGDIAIGIEVGKETRRRHR